MGAADELAQKPSGPPSDADHLDDQSQTSSNAEQFQDDPSSLGSSAFDKHPPSQSLSTLEMEKADELADKAPGLPSGTDHLDDQSQTSLNAEQLQEDPGSLGSSLVDKDTPSQSHRQFKTGKGDELAEKAPGQSLDTDGLDDKSQVSSNAEQLKDEPSSLHSSAIDKGSPPRSQHV